MKKTKNYLRILGILTLVCLLMTGCVAGQAPGNFTFTMVDNGVKTTQVYEGATSVSIQESDNGDTIVTVRTPKGVQKVVISSKSK